MFFFFFFLGHSSFSIPLLLRARAFVWVAYGRVAVTAGWTNRSSLARKVVAPRSCGAGEETLRARGEKKVRTDTSEPSRKS